MLNLTLHWKAVFNDNSSIDQFNSDGSENLFKLVQDRFSELVEFDLIHQEKSFIVTVNLVEGFISVNDQQRPETVFKETKNNIRLIFFRRHRGTIIDTGNIISEHIIYFIGYQYNDAQGDNHQIILQIDEDGNILLGG